MAVKSIRRPLSEGNEKKNLNPPNMSTARPPKPGGSGSKSMAPTHPQCPHCGRPY